MESPELHEPTVADEHDRAETPSGAGGAGPQPVAEAKTISKRRLIFVDALITFTTLLLVVGIFAVWANRLLFSPDNWSSTSTQLLTNPTIRSTTADYAVDQLYANVNVPGLLKSALPTRLQPLAAPAAGALQNVAVQGVDILLQRPRVQDAWAKANRAADETFIAIANGGKGAVGVNQGEVTLNLSQVVDQVALRLGLPSNLGAKLPPKFANLVIFKSNQLKFVQNVGHGIKGLALWLTILVPVLYALAILLASGHRRRTLMSVGFAAVVGGMLVIVGRSIFDGQIVNSVVKDASLRPAVSETVMISTQMLREIAAACIYVGIVLVVSAWLAGPARPAVVTREAIAPFLRDRPGPTYGITLVVMGLIFIWDPIHATGTPAGIIVFTLLALLGTFMLRRQTMEEFPDARSGAATAKFRAWVARRRGGRQPANPPQATDKSIPDQLGQLADLRDRGAISPDEYQAAKARLLQSAP
jgi:putative oligomerization/nucleic acid binding protein